jgi:hypothetical protein
MLLLIEHDHVMANVAARRCLADFVARRPNVTLALPLAQREGRNARQELSTCPTRKTARDARGARDRDLAFALMYRCPPSPVACASRGA